MRVVGFAALVPAVLAIAGTGPPVQRSASAQQYFGQAEKRGDQVVRFSYPPHAPTGAVDGLSWIASLELDIWRATKTSIDVRLSESYLGLVTTLLDGTREESRPVVTTLIPSLAQLARSSSPASTPYNLALSAASLANLTSSEPRPLRLLDPIHDSYHPLDSVYAILALFAAEYPSLTEVIDLGTTSEGHTIKGIKLTNKNSALHATEGKQGFVVAGAQHAREWIAPSTIIYLIHDLLLSAANEDGPQARLLDLFEFTFIPVVNVDGYVYTWEHDRLWRKNRQDVGDQGCKGIDLNRNWGYAWSAGNRPNPCSDSYPGASKFAAPELQALSGYIADPANKVVAFLDVHAYGQMLMFPYSYSCLRKSPYEEDLFEAAVGAAGQLRKVHSRLFEVGSLCDIGVTSSGPGQSVDWVHEVAQVKWSFAIELRDFGTFGFLLPANQIRPSGEETAAMLLSLAESVAVKGRRFQPSPSPV